MSKGQAYGETIFDILYLATAVSLSVIMTKEAKVPEQRLFPTMGFLLAGGDSFHLIPRAISLLQDEMHFFWLGLGKLLTSITMTLFYVLFYVAIEPDFTQKKQTKLTLRVTVAVLALIRVILCCFPQNDWFSGNHTKQNYAFAIARNVPFAILGILIIVMCSMMAKSKFYLECAIAISLSFGFYLPVVLAAHKYEWVGMLMIPKTCAYVWMLFACYFHILEVNKSDI